MADPAVTTRGLTKTFGAVEAVSSVDMTVEAGGMVGLVGPDGAGKTTLLRMFCGVVDPTGGSATILGRDLVRERAAITEHIGYLSQKFSLYRDLTVDENIEFFADIHGVRGFQARREELLSFTRLTPFRARLAEALSGGMKQKLALACALIHTPRIIFLDEPTTGVDPVSRRDFWKILSTLRRTGITIVMTTPYLDEAERCTRVGLMNAGRLMVMDTPAALKGVMRGTVVEVVPGDVRRSAAILKTLEDVREVQAFGDRLNVVVGSRTDASRVQARLEAGGIAVEHCRIIPPSLENVFISLVTRT